MIIWLSMSDTVARNKQGPLSLIDFFPKFISEKFHTDKFPGSIHLYTIPEDSIHILLQA